MLSYAINPLHLTIVRACTLEALAGGKTVPFFASTKLAKIWSAMVVSRGIIILRRGVVSSASMDADIKISEEYAGIVCRAEGSR